MQVEVLNLNGEKIFGQSVFVEIGENNFDINIKNRPVGMYIVKLTGSEGYVANCTLKY